VRLVSLAIGLWLSRPEHRRAVDDAATYVPLDGRGASRVSLMTTFFWSPSPEGTTARASRVARSLLLGRGGEFGMTKLAGRAAPTILVLLILLGVARPSTGYSVLTHEQVVVKDTPNASERKFLYYLSRSQYEKEWGTIYRKPGFKTRILAFLLRLVPKIGPFKALAFQIPTTQTEDMYVKSVDKTVENYASLLREVGAGDLQLPNTDCDTGRLPRAGEYALSDKTYARLLKTLSDHGLDQLTPELRKNILAFYATSSAQSPTKKDRKAWIRTLKELDELKAELPSAVPAPTSVSAADSTGTGVR
jgi:hypothetical protein